MYLKIKDNVRIVPEFLEEFPHLEGLDGYIRSIYGNMIEIYFDQDPVGSYTYDINHKKITLSKDKIRERKIQSILC